VSQACVDGELPAESTTAGRVFIARAPENAPRRLLRVSAVCPFEILEALHGGSHGFLYVPDLAGCVTTGRTLDETERNIREAISGHLETLREFGETVPEPTSVAKEIEIAPAA
jgi:predicted RNase H-like HicB family nuclease